jgi:hypothetical protein
MGLPIMGGAPTLGRSYHPGIKEKSRRQFGQKYSKILILLLFSSDNLE